MPLKRFQKLALATLIATLLLIILGGLVRVSGAGLGCPDWPRCWGCWLPPTDISKIDPDKYDVSKFNLAKMWIEYTNRMVGVVIGLLILATFLHSISLRKTHSRLFWASLAALLLVIFQGWLGGEVVKSGLRPGIITLHMVLALALLTLLLWIVHNSHQRPIAVPGSGRLGLVAGILFALTCLQVVLGTQVRETVDPFIKNEGTMKAQPRSEWLSHSGSKDYAHRILSLVVLGAAVVLVANGRKLAAGSRPRNLAHLVLALVIVQIILGITLAYLGLPRPSQVLHLANSALLICTEVLLLLHCHSIKQSGTAFD